MGCASCETRLSIDERISHQGKIICGHCFVKREAEKPSELGEMKFDTEESSKDEVILQLMESVVMLDERLSSLEERLDKLDVQFDSICG